MKLTRVAKLASVCLASTLATTAFAAAPHWTVDFEHPWDYLNGGVASFYNGGAADEGSTGGANLGVEFIGVSGLSNDSNFSDYSGAPSPQGVAFDNISAVPESGSLVLMLAGVAALTGWRRRSDNLV